MSDWTEQSEIFVTTCPRPGREVQVSSSGGVRVAVVETWVDPLNRR